MGNRAYIIVFEKGGFFDVFDYREFHAKLTSAKKIKSWFHYLSSSYILVTDKGVTATSITNFLLKALKGKHFLVMEVNLKNHNGWLPANAWEWINKWTVETNTERFLP